jgi:hypothetical protein
LRKNVAAFVDVLMIVVLLIVFSNSKRALGTIVIYGYLKPMFMFLVATFISLVNDTAKSVVIIITCLYSP